jgi:hypothetical protein
MAIERLNQGTLSAASQLPFYDSAIGSDARASITALAALIGQLLGTASLQLTQYAAPNATGFNVQVAPQTNGASVWLLLTPLAGYAAGTITLPAVALCQHGQELLLNTTQSVTTLTVAGNGATVNGAPTTLAANAFFRLKFDGVLKVWYRVG